MLSAIGTDLKNVALNSEGVRANSTSNSTSASNSTASAEVKIICPLSSKTTDIVNRIYDNTAHGIKISNGADSLYGTFIVDSEKFLRAELGEPNAIEFSDTIGFTLYSNSRRSAESFKSIFELGEIGMNER